MSHLYHFEVDGLLETWLSALQDYDAGDFDTSVIDTKTAAKYEELLDTGEQCRLYSLTWLSTHLRLYPRARRPAYTG